MPTPASEVSAELQLVTAAAAAEIVSELNPTSPALLLDTLGPVVDALVPEYYDAAGELAVEWYEELRGASEVVEPFTPSIRGTCAAEWIDREVAAYAESVAATLDREAAKYAESLTASVDEEVAKLLAEIETLVQKEVARGYRDSIIGNAAEDRAAVGFSRVARPGACPMCRMLADKGAVYRSERTARFAAHGNCYCLARPVFDDGTHGPEASVEQYIASEKRRSPEQQYLLKKYLHENFGGPPPTPLPSVTEKGIQKALDQGKRRNAPRVAALNALLDSLGT